MRKKTFLCLLFLFHYILTYSQILVPDKLPKFRDGVYSKEHTRERNVTIYNNNIGDYYHNYFFRTTELIEPRTIKPDSVLYDADSNVVSVPSTSRRNFQFSAGNLPCSDSIIDLNTKLKFDDCVFINPMNRFTCLDYVRDKPYSMMLLNEEEKANYTQELQHKLPASLRFYIDTSDIKIVPDQLEMVVDSGFNFPTENYLTPFYFRKYEVTNEEYRAFTNWVFDSIARVLLYEAGFSNYGTELKNTGEYILNKKDAIELNNEKVKEILEPLYYPAEERFYRRRQIDARSLNYCYVKEDSLGKRYSEIINIYPDTLSWIHDFSYWFNEPMTNMYFWHPVYNKYPVVGISYYQAKAFLHWKTQLHQKELDAKGIRIKIIYDLPNEAEWDMVLSTENEAGIQNVYTPNYNYYYDRSWITDLCIKSDDQVIKKDIVHKSKQIDYDQYRVLAPPRPPDTTYKYERSNLLFSELHGNINMGKNQKAEYSFHTIPADIET